MNMTNEDIAINGNEFEYMGETYDCSLAINYAINIFEKKEAFNYTIMDNDFESHLAGLK